ncbi:MAG: hypothetical protein LBI13_07550, partial [Streptococcaceae bacterium]|nr:hypothetical protein [Streptococcaceae bacterium]
MSKSADALNVLWDVKNAENDAKALDRLDTKGLDKEEAKQYKDKFISTMRKLSDQGWTSQGLQLYAMYLNSAKDQYKTGKISLSDYVESTLVSSQT